MAFDKPKSEFDREMLHLDAEIRRLEAEFNMFFAGRLPRPPWETRARVTALVKKHDQSYINNTADRFRFESMQNRFQKFLELWERQMNNRELGRPTIGARRPPPVEPASPTAADAAKTAAAPAASASATDKAKARVAAKADAADAKVRFSHAEGSSDERVKQLYQQLSEAKKQVGEKPVAMDRVAALVKAQVDKFGGKDVTFKVALKDGKVSLTAKAADEKD